MVFHAFDIEKVTHELINTKAIEPLIIVGIDNGGSTDKTTNPVTDRAYEFLPYPDVGFAPELVYKADPPAPAGIKYPEFLGEVRSLVAAKYRVKSGPANTAIGGFSYGGVAALYAAMNHPGIYGRLLLESTPLWIGEDLRLIDDAGKVKKWPSRIYIGLGSVESPEAAVNDKGRALHDQLMKYLTSSGSKPKVTLRVEDGAKHEPRFWAQRFPDALKVLFGE
jgi:predicted alpha/beta superfamily hydrolase